MSDRIVMRTSESLVAGGAPFTAAEPEVVIGEFDGPVGTAIATLTGDQSVGHSKVFAILNTDIQVRPANPWIRFPQAHQQRQTPLPSSTPLPVAKLAARVRGERPTSGSDDGNSKRERLPMLEN